MFVYTKFMSNRSRLSCIYGGVAVVIALAVGMIWYMLPSREDLSAEKRLVGKWGIWKEGSDMSLPTERIIEWQPEGQVAHYSPWMEPLGNSTESSDRTSHWRIRNGKLIIESRVPELKDGLIREEVQLDWQDTDTLRAKIESGDGTNASVLYKRILPTL
jgi:hypothetical protein